MVALSEVVVPNIPHQLVSSVIIFITGHVWRMLACDAWLLGCISPIVARLR